LDFNQVLQRHSYDKLFIADETTKKAKQAAAKGKSHINGYKYIVSPTTIKNSKGETLVDFFNLANPSSIETTQRAVNEYYNHNLNEPAHQSNNFKKYKSENFGCFASNNLLPYVTADTNSSHNNDHKKCVQKLIEELRPLSDQVNNYIENTYPTLYNKMKKLDLGSNVPKSYFGGFPIASINFNSICQFHRDLQDHRNTFCVVCPLGIFEGGQIAFPELNLAFEVKQGQAIAFRSCLLVHGNFGVTSGIRHSVVFYIHKSLVKQERPFTSLGSFEFNLDINSDDSDFKQLPKKKKLSSKSLTNSRKDNIGKCYFYIKIYIKIYINIYFF